MNRRHKHDTEKEQQWRAIFAKHKASGKSITAFCKDAGITESKFYSWRRLIMKRSDQRIANAPAEQKTFVPIQLTAQPEPTDGFELRTPSGYTVRIPAAIANELIQMVVKLLVNRQC